MITLLLCLLFVVPVSLLPMALARRAARSALRQRAVVVAAVGGRDLRDVERYTHDCAHAACLLIEHAPSANRTFVHRMVYDAVQQIDTVQRAERLRGALGRVWRPRSTGVGTLSGWLLDLLLFVGPHWITAAVTAAGPRGVVWLQRMTATALARFRVAATDEGEGRFRVTFASELSLLDIERATRRHRTAEAGE